MDDFALTPAERALFRALGERGVRFLIVGLGAAVLEGAPVSTQDLDVWPERIDDPRLDVQSQAAVDAGVNVVLTAHGLDAFEAEYDRAIEREIDGVALRVLPLERVLASKSATNRPKDRAALPALEAALLARRRQTEP